MTLVGPVSERNVLRCAVRPVPLDALLHLRRAVELDPKWAEHAAKDPDFDPIRAEPGYPA